MTERPSAPPAEPPPLAPSMPAAPPVRAASRARLEARARRGGTAEERRACARRPRRRTSRRPARDERLRAPAAPADERRYAPEAARPRRPIARHLRALQLLAGAARRASSPRPPSRGARAATSCRALASPCARCSSTASSAGPLSRWPAPAASSVGKNIFTLDLELAGASIATDPWIERPRSPAGSPRRSTSTSSSARRAALVAIGGDLYLATRDGELFKELAEDDPVDLPIVTGITGEQVARDRPGVVIAVRRAARRRRRHGARRRRAPLSAPGAPPREGRARSSSPSARRPSRSTSGSRPTGTRSSRPRGCSNELAQRKANASVIFLDNDAHPERVVVRMR